MNAVAAVAPYVDSAISKTVNVPADYPYTEFEGLYFAGWKAGLKGLATYRPNAVLGSVLSTGTETPAATPAAENASNRRRISSSPTSTAASKSRRCRPRAGKPEMARPARSSPAATRPGAT
jgi:ribonucleoside-diphosphate reductase alpha chain